MFMNLFRSLGLVALGLAIFGGAYPLLIAGIGRLLFPNQVQGSMVSVDKRNRGSMLIAQPFTENAYLMPRPSAAGTHGYDGAASSGSSKAIVSQRMREVIQTRVTEYRLLNRVPDATNVPIDAVTDSASGLDPHVSLENALLQAARIATTRNISERQVRSIIRDKSIRSLFDRLEQRRVNVLECNLAIDQFTRYTHFDTDDKLRD